MTKTFNNCSSDFYLPINLSINDAFCQEFQWPTIEDCNKRKLIYFNDLRTIFSDKWINSCHLAGINIKNAMMFYKPANHIPDYAHVDVVNQDLTGSVVCALNWTIGGGDSKMKWYSTKNDTREIINSMPGVPSANYNFSNLTEIHNHTLCESMTLVRTNIPHAIWTGNESRWCISVRLPYGQLKSWEEAQDFFSDLCYN